MYILHSTIAVLEASIVLCLGSVALLFTVVPVAIFLQLKDSKREDIVLFTIFGLFTGKTIPVSDFLFKLCTACLAACLSTFVSVYEGMSVCLFVCICFTSLCGNFR